MIEALLHGKLSREQENMEDILTSNMFGLLQYVPPEKGLLPFLAKAESLDGEKPLADLGLIVGAALENTVYSFWPSKREVWPNCEPDVVIRLGSDLHKPMIILIEAKYHSGKSSLPDYGVDHLTDQLAREWDDLVHCAKRESREPYLVFLTTDVGCPHAAIKESLEEYRKKRCGDACEPAICWLSWRRLAEPFFADHNHLILRQLSELAQRLGLHYFRGIEPLEAFPFQWSFENLDIRFRLASVPTPFQWDFEP